MCVSNKQLPLGLVLVVMNNTSCVANQREFLKLPGGREDHFGHRILIRPVTWVAMAMT